MHSVHQLLFVTNLFCYLLPINWFVTPNFRIQALFIQLIQLVRSKKYSQLRGPRNPSENFSQVNKSWFTVFNTFWVLFTISYSVFSTSYPVLLDLLILSEKSVSKIDSTITNFTFRSLLIIHLHFQYSHDNHEKSFS